jgi:hypothetical protein
MWWDAGKTRFKRLMRRYSRERASSRRSCIQSLECTLFHLNCRENNGKDVSHLIADVKASLQSEHSHWAHGARLREK